MFETDIIEGKKCPYCGEASIYIDSKVIYGVSYGMIYLCRPCDAYVGVHKGSNKALGRLANWELRGAKRKAHEFFDILWKAAIQQWRTKREARNSAYVWLAGQLELSIEHTHIGMFDLALCNKVIDLCKPYVEKLKKPRTQTSEVSQGYFSL